MQTRVQLTSGNEGDQPHLRVMVRILLLKAHLLLHTIQDEDVVLIEPPTKQRIVLEGTTSSLSRTIVYSQSSNSKTVWSPSPLVTLPTTRMEVATGTAPPPWRLQLEPEIQDLLKAISESPRDENAYSKHEFQALAFPSLLIQGQHESDPTGKRFEVTPDRLFKYLGRSAFKLLLEKLRAVTGRCGFKLFIQGTSGSGKSHLIAALACYLRTQLGNVVIYIPDAALLRSAFVNNLANAILVATWPEIPPDLDELRSSATENDIHIATKKVFDYLNDQPRCGRVYLIIDQVDNWKGKGVDKIQDDHKRLKDNLEAVSSTTISIFSSSANFSKSHVSYDNNDGVPFDMWHGFNDVCIHGFAVDWH